MMMISVACAIAFVLLALRRRQIPRNIPSAAPAEPRDDRAAGLGRSRRRWLVALPSVASLWLVHQTFGTEGLVLAIAGLTVLGTCLRLAMIEMRSQAAWRARVTVAQACGVVASQLRVGRAPGEALRTAAADAPVLAKAVAIHDLGGDVATALRSQSATPGHAGLADLSRAWQVSIETGAPMASSLEQVADALRADQAVHTVINAELSAARATGKIMAALPLCGIGIGYLIGGDPLGFLLSGPVGWLCLDLGVLLAAAGALWIDQLARRPGEQGC